MFLPAIDSIDPVTPSQRFTHEILRGELGFDGVVTTDDIGMHAVSTIFEDVAAAVRAIFAGTDMLMVCSHWTDTDRCRRFADALIRAKQSGIISSNLLDRSQERIHTLLARSKVNEVVSLPAARLAAHRKAGKLFSAETVEVM